MPKTTTEAKERRREEILDGARRCFASWGYEGATVVRLEAETGLSRGGIFNYFGSKEDLFLALAERDAERLGRAWADSGVPGIFQTLIDEDPAWLGAYLEVGRRLRTDAAFRERWDQRAPEVEQEILERMRGAQKRGELRADLSLETIGTFIGLVADGLAMRRAAGFPSPATDELVELVESAIGSPVSGDRARSDTPPRRSV